MMKLIFSIVFLFSNFSIGPAALFASDSSYCYRDLQLYFFEPDLVYQSLSIYQIPQGLWAPITQNLRVRSFQIPERMKKITARMVPNPLDYPMQKGVAAAILKQTLMDAFYETMSKYQVNERPTADFVFDYIFAQQLPKFIGCFGEEARQLAPSFE